MCENLRVHVCVFDLFYLQWFWLKEINIILQVPFSRYVSEHGRSLFSSEETWHSFRMKFLSADVVAVQVKWYLCTCKYCTSCQYCTCKFSFRSHQCLLFPKAFPLLGAHQNLVQKNVGVFIRSTKTITCVR